MTNFEELTNKFEEVKQEIWTNASIVEGMGMDAIPEWAEKQYKVIQDDIEYMAAFVTVLNHKCWYWYEANVNSISAIYSDLYYKYNDIEWNWLEKHGTEEEKHWYFETLD